MVTTLLKIPIFGQSVQKLHSYSVLQHMCTLFTYPTRFAVEFAPIRKFKIGGIYAVARVTTPPKSSEIANFAHLCPPRHFVHTFHMTQTIHA